MSYDDLIKAFGEKLGGGIELKPDETGTVMLDVDGMPLSILGLEDIGLVVLSGIIGEPPPADGKERLYEAILKANYNFMGTSGATMSINPDSGEVSLCKALPLDLTDGDKFFAETEGFLNVLESWRKIVSDFRGSIDEPAHKAEDAGGTGAAADFGGFGNGFMQV